MTPERKRKALQTIKDMHVWGGHTWDEVVDIVVEHCGVGEFTPDEVAELKAVIIHYYIPPRRGPGETACGIHSRDMLDSARLTGDTDSVDCADCISTDAFKSDAMERVLLKGNT